MITMTIPRIISMEAMRGFSTNESAVSGGMVVVAAADVILCCIMTKRIREIVTEVKVSSGLAVTIIVTKFV